MDFGYLYKTYLSGGCKMIFTKQQFYKGTPMKAFIVILILSLLFILGCDTKLDKNNSKSTFEQQFISTPDSLALTTIIIPGLTLITDNYEKEKSDALEILQLKHKFPLAMQTKSKEIFEEIFAVDFVFRADDEFFNREDYINDRINGTWEIDTVKYQNLALQFFGDKAVLTYKNILDGTDDYGKPNIEYYSWADIYVRENGDWKILSCFTIDSRMEYK